MPIVLTIQSKVHPGIRMNYSGHVVGGYSVANFSNFSSSLSTSSEVNFTGPSDDLDPIAPKWGVLAIVLIVFCTALGNLLVCLAVIWDRRLQNMTNYFLMSLAIADFLVSILVMPFGMIVELFGNFPLHPEFCIFWVTMDVLMCTASIWHMCTMSMDRYFTLKYPMKYGRNKTKMTVALKILFVWLVSITISSPICVYGISNTSSVFNNGQCVPAIRDFVIYGSIFAFYIPLTIMLITYILTIRILWKNQKLMKKIDRSDLKTLQRHSEKCEMKTLLCPPKEDNERSNELSNTNGSVMGTLLNTPKCEESQESQTTLLSNGVPTIGPACSQTNPSLPNQEFHSKYSIMCADTVTDSREKDMLQIKSPTAIFGSREKPKKDLKFEQKASSLSCLNVLRDHDPPSYNSICHKSPRFHPLMDGPGDDFLRINSNESLVGHSFEKSCLSVHQAVSCSTVHNSNSIISNLVPCAGNSHFHSCSDIGKKDLKLVEWKENYSKIQKEMDQILKGDFDKEDTVSDGSQFIAQVQSSRITLSGSEESIWSKEIHSAQQKHTSSKNSTDADDKGQITKHLQQISDRGEKNVYEDDDDSSEVFSRSTSQLIPGMEASQQFSTTTNNNNNNNTAFSKCQTETSLLNVVTSHRVDKGCPCANRPSSQCSNELSTLSHHSIGLSESGESMNDPSEVSESSECLTIKLHPHTLHACTHPNQKSSSPSTPLLSSHSRLYNGSARQLCNGTGQHNGQVGKDMSNMMLRTPTIHRLLSKFNKTQGMTPVMSKRATTNERKASKVLGIIFAVFVILWTPFFTVNILSVTCEHCMQNVTSELMSVFVWMGYTASLANPIIYTMFNTAFRRAFIRILKCHICINGSLRAADRSTIMSYPMSYTERKRNCGQISVNHHSPL